MFRITVQTAFTAGHQLTFPTGPEPYHIHDWIAEAAIQGPHLDENGLLFDFTVLKKFLDDIVTPFKDSPLEDFDCFKNINTSAENVAKYIYFALKNHLPKNISLLYIEVTEAPLCKARFSETQV
ncbi:MAG: 6-carboxytetrahydropterin synthase [Phycisphaerales bacterium]